MANELDSKSTNHLISKVFECLIKTNDYTKVSSDNQFINIVQAIQMFTIEENFHAHVGSYIYRLDKDDFNKITNMFDTDVFLSLTQSIQSAQKVEGSDTKSNVFKKLDDSIRLSIAQRNFIEKSSNSANDVASKATKKAAKAKKIADEMQDIKKSIYTDFIAILGIFTAITFASFGATSMLTSVLTSITNPSLTKIGYCLIIIGVYLVALYGLISVMLVGTYKIMHGHDLYTDENGNDFPDEYNFSKKLFWVIIGFVLFLLILGIIIVDRQNIPIIRDIF